MNTAEQRRKWYEKHREEQIQRAKERYKKNKVKMQEWWKVYSMENKDKITERKRKYHQKYYQERKLIYKDRKLRYKHKISLKEFECLLIGQDHKCTICGKPLIDKTTVIDHDHLNGKIRGILCRLCNTGLGFFFDDPWILNKGIEYLRRNNGI